MRTVHPPQARRQIEEEKLIQRKTTGNVQAQTAPSIVYHVLRSPGQPLDVSTREFMETRFGHDFSRVRVHTDPRAADSARALDALAYTVGRDVVFGAGQYTKGSNESRKLIAHELTHVIQQGFTSQAIQRQPANKPKKKATTNPKSIYEQIKKRNPDLAELITPQSIDFSNPKAPPDIKGGPMKDGEEHHWKVRVLAGQGFANSQTVTGSEARKKAPGGLIVTHFIDITWALPLAADQEFIKQPISEDEAFTLTAAESLYHELLHARIIMERDPRWTSQHTQVFQGYANILQIAGSAAVDKERQELKGRIGALASGGGTATTPADLTKAEDLYYEFLVHEKYDADTESKPFGRTFPNALIAEKYSKVVAMRLRAGDRALHVLTDQLAASAEKLFNKLDQATQTGIPSAPSGDSPATKQPKK
ncbi:MAG: DUF4157 domain-containing protein [Chloracidobacterium sp.]|nr:DUF4157 domain-containing protein [Chloracidobacterium sp.]